MSSTTSYINGHNLSTFDTRDLRVSVVIPALNEATNLPHVLPRIPSWVHGALLAGADFVKGSRFLRGGGTADMPFYRKLGNWGFVLTVRVVFGGKYSDLCYGYNAFWKRVLPSLNLDGDGFEIETIMNVRAL